MSINKRHVPGLEEVKKQYILMGHNKFVKHWVKTDVFIGNAEGIDFINEKLAKGEVVEKISK